MKMTELFLAELEAEGALTRRVLENAPEGKPDWKPHPKSMPLGYLAALVARMPGWVAMTIKEDQLDLKPKDGSRSPYTPVPLSTRRELLQSLDDSLAEARVALAGTTDDHLLTPWRLLVGGHLVSENPRYQVLRNAVFNHLAHHRGQLTVYLRLNDEKVPAIYGPSADEGQS
jgi:uncharacterized damage-inducible protein DinB